MRHLHSDNSYEDNYRVLVIHVGSVDAFFEQLCDVVDHRCHRCDRLGTGSDPGVWQPFYFVREGWQ